MRRRDFIRSLFAAPAVKLIPGPVAVLVERGPYRSVYRLPFAGPYPSVEDLEAFRTAFYDAILGVPYYAPCVDDTGDSG